MRWLNRIIEYLIVFGLGVIVGWHPTFAGVKAFLLNGASFAVVLGVVIQMFELLRDWFKNQKEEHAKEQERLEQERDKEWIYDWVYRKTQEYKAKRTNIFNTLNDPRYRSTEEIANALNIYPLENVRKLCYINDKLIKMTYENLYRDKETKIDEKSLEKWAIKEFIREYNLTHGSHSGLV